MLSIVILAPICCQSGIMSCWHCSRRLASVVVETVNSSGTPFFMLRLSQIKSRLAGGSPATQSADRHGVSTSNAGTI
jgi:hypothetical protein